MTPYSIKSIMQIPQNVVQDVQSYKQALSRFLSGQLSSAMFKAHRVPMGIYEQRKANTYMIRIRIPAGLVWPGQLERIAGLCSEFGNGSAHITTRQDIQIHDVSIEDTARIIDDLLEVGLTTRGGGGNTVRNCTTCPRSGVCKKEAFDVTAHAIALTEYMLQFPGSFNLPRKFKIVLSGCSRDCGFASVADLGFFAKIDSQGPGFAVYAAGGLGPNPAVGIQIERFVDQHQIFLVAQAVKAVFDLHGDRLNRHRARFRYVLARLGPDQLIDEYVNQKQRLLSEGLPGNVPDLDLIARELTVVRKPGYGNGTSVLPLDLLPEKANGYYTIRIAIPDGDIPASDLASVARIAENFCVGQVRTTQDQDLLLLSVPSTSLSALSGELQRLSIWPLGHGPARIVSCAGASTCKLGLCMSRNLAAAIRNSLQQIALVPKVKPKAIRISGCPNSCGQHLIADIGLAGKACRTPDGLVPCYDLFVGAQLEEGLTRLARRVATIPAALIPALLARSAQNGFEDIEKLAVEYAFDRQTQIPSQWYMDIGATSRFSLEGRGPGECGAGVLELIQTDIARARDALRQASRTAEDLPAANAARFAARALLVLFGQEPKDDIEILECFDRHLVHNGWVEGHYGQICRDILLGKIKGQQVIDQLDRLVTRIEALFMSLDSDLKFRLKPIESKQTISVLEAKQVVDLRGVPCPMNFVKAKLALENIPIGAVLRLILDEGEPSQNVCSSLVQSGHQIAKTDQVSNAVYLDVVRSK